MREIPSLIILCAVVLVPPLPMLALEFDNADAAGVYFAEIERIRQEIRGKMQKGATDDAMLKEALIQSFNLMSEMPPYDTTTYARSLMREYEIPREQQIRVLESMIRETLSTCETDRGGNVRYSISHDILPLLGAIADYDISPVVQKCLLSKDELVRLGVLIAYAKIADVKAIPSIRETIEKGRLDKMNCKSLYSHLEGISRKLNKENKINEGEQITAFLKEMKQAEKPKEEGGN